MILADEIDRTPPKTQAAMLEAMQERQSGRRGNYEFADPFFVLATQNPLEQEAYPLPEAQLDRFLLYIKVDYPSRAEEWEIARRVTGGPMGQIAPLFSRETSSNCKNWSRGCRSAIRCWVTPGHWSAPHVPARKRPPIRQSLGRLGPRASEAC